MSLKYLMVNGFQRFQSVLWLFKMLSTEYCAICFFEFVQPGLFH